LSSKHGWVDVGAIKASARSHASEITHTMKISASCEDNLELLEVICRLSPAEERASIRADALQHFARRNYRLAGNVRGEWRSLQAYAAVFRKFGLRYPPPRAACAAQLRGLLRRLWVRDPEGGRAAC
jgi:hypothetical protein